MRAVVQGTRGGFAMVAVLLTLMALFVLSAPFLLTVRSADQAAGEVADRSSLRIGLDSAERHALARLGGSHPGLDQTPWSDSADELDVTNDFPEGFLDADDPAGVMWDLDVEDVAGRVDLGSAPPQVIANLMGAVARTTSLVTGQDVQLKVSSTEGFEPEGTLVVDGEWIAYGAIDGSSFERLQRGLMAPAGDGAEDCGPRRAMGHELGAFVVDQRAWAIAEWRIATGDFRPYDRIESLRKADDFVLNGSLGRDAYLTLEGTTTAYGGVRAGARWQRAVRMVSKVDGEPAEGCRLAVDDLRWFNPGTTVRISDGRSTEYALVLEVGNGQVTLDRSLKHRFEAYLTRVEALARRPVNVNTASPAVLEALWKNLKLKQFSARITGEEARELVDLVLVSRPFTGLEDFLRRVVLPAGGLDELPGDAPIRPDVLAELARQKTTGADGAVTLKGFLDPEDAVAVYKNALDANDAELEFSTMPLSFVSRDVYDLSLRAFVNAASGIARASGRREVVDLVVPQEDLLAVWTRQEDFEDAPRLDRDAAHWMTGPNSLSRHDPLFGATASMRWPSRARAHLGPDDTAPSLDPLGDSSERVFASREEGGWAQLLPMREEATRRGARHALHFDDETRELEGRYLPDGVEELDLTKLGWGGGGAGSTSGGLMKGLRFGLWMKPRQLEEGAVLLSVGGNYSDSDRLTLTFEQQNLVLRLLDGAADHATSAFEEEALVRYPLTGNGPGLPLDTWSHVQVVVDGNRPDQMMLLVDGRRADDTPGLTRLSSALAPAGDTIRVDSTEGFPDKCVLRIGDELIEAIKTGANSFRARHEKLGENAGFGGRIARELFQGASPQEVNQGLFKVSSTYAVGTPVQLYGYSLPLFSSASNDASSLTDPIGAFAVARVEGIVKSGSEKRMSAMEPITINSANVIGSFDIGWGMDGLANDVEGLLLAPADPNMGLETTMAAFSPGGGYAAIVGVAWREGPGSQTPAKDVNGTRLGGVEVVRYTGVRGNVLQLAPQGRGDQVGLARSQGHQDTTGRAGWLIYYRTDVGQTWNDHNQELTYQVKVLPISVPARTGRGFLTSATLASSNTNQANFAQLTHSGGESHLTEWFRFDELSSDGRHFVRDDALSLLAAQSASAASQTGDVSGPRPQAPRQPAPAVGLLPTPATAPAPPAAAPVPQQGGGAEWFHAIGEPEDEDFLVARAVSSAFQFRGVLGTYGHAHPAGTLVLPVFQVFDEDETLGYPGRFDAVTFLNGDPDDPGFTGVVQHAHRPFDHTRYYWQDGGPLAPAMASAPTAEPQSGMNTNVTYVALDAALPVPISRANVTPGTPKDNRLLERMVMFPSGELPRNVTEGWLGRNVRSPGTVPSVLVDEALFYDSAFVGLQGLPAQLVVLNAIGETDSRLQVEPQTLRTTLGDSSPLSGVTGLPTSGGLLRVGKEILCYETVDTATGLLTLAQGGRGLLGSEPQPHQVGEGVTPLLKWPVGILAVNLGADDAEIALAELPRYLPQQGTLWIEGELVHYTRVNGNVLEMPRGSKEPGAHDQKGPGLFRGRYGTPRAGHAAGTPVILWPFRYWDRWSELADEPEMAWYGLSADQPDAFWKSVFWKAGDAGQPGPEIGVLGRTDPAVPWDADPAGTPGLWALDQGRLDAAGNPLGVQADRAEWRVFVRWRPGAFDPDLGLAHGWKATPRLELFGLEYMGPGRTLERVDR